MNRPESERIITEYLKPIYGFALKNCRNIHDAEDLSQEIVLRAYRALLAKDDIADPGRFIRTVAHNTLCNYYRNLAKTSVGVPLDAITDEFSLVDPDSQPGADDTKQSIARLQSEIAYLSKMQRRIVIACYFENKKQETIAAELGIPLGTVKWHLHEAKKDLKKGMDTMRQASELKYNPIKFHSYGFNGNPGTTDLSNFFRSTLTQNICCCVRRTAMTVNEIADALGVSPVYVEDEVEHLEEYGFLTKQKDKYIVNFLISEPSAELLTMQNKMYRKAGEIFANELFDELTNSGILNDPDIVCAQTDDPIDESENRPADHNFLLWTLIPYIAAWSGEHLMEETVTFEEVATIRPDGGQNIACATVVPDDMVLPDDYVYMQNWFGPCWNAGDRYTLWQLDTEWSGRRLDKVPETAMRVLSLYGRPADEPLSKDECTWLAERGYIRTNGSSGDKLKVAWQIVTLANPDIRKRLIAIGDRIKEKHKAEFDALKAPYVEAELALHPKHVRKMKAFELQFLFSADGWFLLHCLNTLVENGKLQIPTENQKKSMTYLIYPN